MVRTKIFGLVFLSLFVFAFTAFAYGSESNVLTFKSWKQQKLAEAKSVVASLKREIKNTRNNDKTRIRLNQAQINLDVIKQLNANDYFVLYLMVHFKENPKALLDASRGLSKQDMASILDGYRKLYQIHERPAAPSIDTAALEN